jgi:hypothetical protein
MIEPELKALNKRLKLPVDSWLSEPMSNHLAHLIADFLGQSDS